MKRITVVLHRPIYPRNIGMCARAMANMGVERLVIVGAQCDLNAEARQGAAHAQEVLRSAVIYRDLKEFEAAEGRGLRIALSGKDGRLKRPESLDDVLNKIARDTEHPFHAADDFPLYLIFGAEDDGLTTEEMELAHNICRLPTFGEITSLNISHAVLLTLFLVRDRLLQSVFALDEKPVRAAGTYYPRETIKRWLETLGFDLTARRVTIEKTLNRIFLSRCPTDEELRIIDNVLQQTVRKLENTAPGRTLS